jgi:hypothetical protein
MTEITGLENAIKVVYIIKKINDFSKMKFED